MRLRLCTYSNKPLATIRHSLAAVPPLLICHGAAGLLQGTGAGGMLNDWTGTGPAGTATGAPGVGQHGGGPAATTGRAQQRLHQRPQAQPVDRKAAVNARPAPKWRRNMRPSPLFPGASRRRCSQLSPTERKRMLGAEARAE